MVKKILNSINNKKLEKTHQKTTSKKHENKEHKEHTKEFIGQIISKKPIKISKEIQSNFNFKSTEEIPVPKRIIDQVIGQEHAVEVMKKAAVQRRHVLLIGEPGTGKSLLGVALAELLPKEKLVDILSFPNPNDENKPLIRTVSAGKGREVVLKSKLESMNTFKGPNIFLFIIAIIGMIAPWWMRSYYAKIDGVIAANILFAATFLGGIALLMGLILVINMSKRMGGDMKLNPPRLIVDNFEQTTAPFVDATGAHAGALLGDVLHDPFQSGGLGTPANERVVSGMIHKAHMGVLFIDEIAILSKTSQQELLTAVQEGKFSITGQSERSAGAMVKTEPVPCKFILIAAGNLDGVSELHPALRSRIRGYGYEIYMEDSMPDTEKNRFKIAQFVAQEVLKDGKIPHFSKEAVDYIVEEARKKANRKNHLTLRLRELGGLVRTAGDIAIEEKAKLVTVNHLNLAKKVARGLEKQLADKYIENKKDYEVIITKGARIGRINGLAVLGSGGSLSGIIQPIEAEVTLGGKDNKIIATGKLGEIAKEAIINVSALVKKYFGEDINQKYDLYVQFLQTYEGLEGDSASLAVATALISALKNIPINQEFAITGSVSVRGDALPIGGATAKIEAAIDAGIKNVIIPRSNLQDVVIDKDRLAKINIIAVDNFIDVLEHILIWDEKNSEILKQIKKYQRKNNYK
jgi:ATP-dependent Lon protease